MIKGNSKEVPEIKIPELEEAIKKCPMRNKPWTDEETAVLIKYYGRLPTVKIAKYLNRSYGSVLNKVTDLGLNVREIRTRELEKAKTRGRH